MQELTPEEKYFYIYILTNPYVTQAGIFKLSLKSAEAETGYNKETILKLIERFCEKDKIKYNPDTYELAIKNWAKYNLPNCDKSDKIIKCIKKEIEEVKDKTLIPYVFAEKIIPLIYPYHTPTIPLTRGIIEEKIENYTPTVKEKKKENNIKKEKEKIKKEFEEEFEELWKEYPKKEGKGEALKSYIKFRGEYSKEDCLKAIKNYVKQKIDIDKTEYKFLKMGSTFFNCFPEYINIVPGNGKKEIKEVEPDDDIDNWGYRTEFKKETAV